MSYIYSDPTREEEPHALPDVEVFEVSQLVVNYNLENLDHADEMTITEAGWYYQFGFPGCLPDGEPNGPFDTKEKAIEDIGESNGIEWHEHVYKSGLTVKAVDVWVCDDCGRERIRELFEAIEGWDIWCEDCNGTVSKRESEEN